MKVETRATVASTEGTAEYRVFFHSAEDGQRVSPWHDVPLHVNKEMGIFRAVIEIPRGTTEKMEICKGETGNPIKQDIKNGKLRTVTYEGGYPWNYGALPQTYENPDHVDPSTKAKGDADPLDVCEIGSALATRGEVKEVKVLGCLAMIDEGETDWKIVCIDVHDAKAEFVHDIGDVEKYFPGVLDRTREWFRNYKTIDGKPQNMFAFDEQFKDRATALEVIHENYGFWKALRAGDLPSKGFAI